MKFGLIYDSSYCHISAQHLRQSIPESDCIHFDLNILKSGVEMTQLLETARGRGTIPDVILHETGAPGLPRGLNRTAMPTACLDVDTFGWTSFRLKWALLFDYVFTWHPSYVPLFRDMGHPNVYALPHAVDARLYAGADAEVERPHDVGFVGNFGLPQYATRDRINTKLAARFRMNDSRKRYNNEETADVYKHSRVVVNVSRAEFPQEANMRCYEAMAAGALLITGVPTELAEWGFREGEHFIGWRSEDEIPGLVEQFLRSTKERALIARAGQTRTLKDFTYQRCLETVSGVMGSSNGDLLAPARRWTAEAVHLLYLSYYHRLRLSDAALEEFRLLRRVRPQAYWKGLPIALKSLRHAVKSSLL
jgi:hypothetical protein